MTADPYIVYDGECPFCSNFVGMIRLREVVGTVRLLNARDGGPEVQALADAGYDLDEGMAFVNGDEIWFGEECVHRLALLTTPSGLFNRFNRLIFSRRQMSRMLYPIMRFGRNMTLWLLGRQKINAVAKAPEVAKPPGQPPSF